jgi:hypothetical protein
MLNHLTGKSPEYFRFMMNNPQPATPAMKFGSAFHMNVLQPQEFNKGYAVSPKFDRRTKQGKEDYAEFIKNNVLKTIISEDDYHLIEQMTDKLMRDSDAKTLISAGDKERIIVWNNEEYNVNCKGMLDVYREDSDIIIDLKTTSDIDKFRWSASKFNYDSQAYIYSNLFGYEMLFMVIDKETLQIGLFDCSPQFYESGEDKVRRATDAYDLFYKTEDFDSKQFLITKTL